jgi:hypothetical protein
MTIRECSVAILLHVRQSRWMRSFARAVTTTRAKADPYGMTTKEATATATTTTKGKGNDKTQ